jgi:hypothetical protein
VEEPGVFKTELARGRDGGGCGGEEGEVVGGYAGARD